MKTSIFAVIAVVLVALAVVLLWYLRKSMLFSKGNYGKKTVKSILNRYVEAGGNLEAGEILPASNGSEKNLMLQLSGFGSMIESAFEEKAPHKICAYIYEVSNAFNSFYHETKILSEENQAQKESYIRLLQLTKRVLETSIDLLGFEAPDKM